MGVDEYEQTVVGDGRFWVGKYMSPYAVEAMLTVPKTFGAE